MGEYVHSWGKLWVTTVAVTLRMGVAVERVKSLTAQEGAPCGEVLQNVTWDQKGTTWKFRGWAHVVLTAFLHFLQTPLIEIAVQLQQQGHSVSVKVTQGYQFSWFFCALHPACVTAPQIAFMPLQAHHWPGRWTDSMESGSPSWSLLWMWFLKNVNLCDPIPSPVPSVCVLVSFGQLHHGPAPSFALVQHRAPSGHLSS